MTTPAGLPREPRMRALRYWLAERRVAVIGWLVVAAVVVGGLGLVGAGVVDPRPGAEPETSFGMDGASLYERGATGADVEVGAVGDGAQRTYVIREAGARGRQPTVIFLHGFGGSLITGYEPWISHLARQGLTVVFPSWQVPPFRADGGAARTNMFAGVRLALAEVPPVPGKLAVIGFSAGGALAFDYAALSVSKGLPPAQLVYSIYPGRAFASQQRPILPIPPVSGMPAQTRVVTLVSPKDREAGTRWGRQQFDALAARPASLRSLISVTEPGLGSHYAPGETTLRARRTFWKPFDAELTRHLGVTLKVDRDVMAATREERAVAKDIERQSFFRKRAIEGKAR